MKDFSWIQCPVNSGGPGPISDHACAVVFHSKHIGPEFGLFKWPDKLKKLNTGIIHEGVYIFGG